tara:strand:+ start:202 stop:549 length:348 start_codon:yes stop_codon:yes gene_type:complete
MLISEVISSEREDTADELLAAVKNVLSFHIADPDDEVDIPTDEFQRNVELELNRPINIDTLMKAVRDSEFAVSINKSRLRAKGDLDQDVDTEAEPTVDVSKMAGNQAMKDIKADL